MMDEAHPNKKIKAYPGSIILSCLLPFLLVTTSTAHAECTRDRLKIYPSQTTATTHWVVNKNEACGVIFNFQGKAGLTNFMITARPAHGGAGGINGIADHGFGYRPASGYVGQDHFQVSGDNYNGSADLTQKILIDVDVDVVAAP